MCQQVLSNSKVLFLQKHVWSNLQLSERTVAMQHHEQFFMKPFQIKMPFKNQIANTFDVKCQVSACSKTDIVKGYCLPGNACKERYAAVGLRSLSTKTSNEVATERGRRDVESVCELLHK